MPLLHGLNGRLLFAGQWEQAYPTSGYSLGKFDDSQPTVSLVDSGNPGRGPKLSFTNGDTVRALFPRTALLLTCSLPLALSFVQCWTYQGQIQRTVHVNVECGQAYTGKIDVTEDTNTCTFTVTLPAQGKCKVPGGGSDGKGLSGGSVFLIIFFVSAFLYVTIGCIYKRKKQGTTGIEACPNIDFWRELPGLVKDGIKCTLSGFKRGGGSYETV